MSEKRVAVIGAGITGLTVIKCLKEENFEPICFEKLEVHGGLWRYHDDDEEGIASVMKTTIINSSKEMGAISDFPPPDEIPNYMHNKEVFHWFSLLAEKCDLLRHVIFNREVVKIELAENYLETGQLTVTVRNTRSGELSTDTYDGVAVCIGHHVYPNMPTFPGQEKYNGTIMHTHSLKTVDCFADKVVVIVGMGNSGIDAAVEISSVSKQVYLSTRHGTWIFPRIGPAGIPFDLFVTSRFNNQVFQFLPFNITCTLLELVLTWNFDHDKYNIKPKNRVLSQHPTISDTLPIKLLSGTVKMKRNVKEFVENGAIFEGEDVVTEANAVIFATGYLMKFPFLNADITTVKDNKVHLYKYMYPPHLVHHTFAIIGLIQPGGAGFPAAEAQARLFCQVLNGKVSLPGREDQEKDIQAKNEINEKRYVASKRHTIQVDYIPFIDEICSMFGAKPNLFKIFFTDPKLFFALFFGPSLPYQYRLQGPHSWEGAREAILTYKSRVYTPLKKDYISMRKTRIRKVLLLFLFSVLVVVLMSKVYN